MLLAVVAAVTGAIAGASPAAANHTEPWDCGTNAPGLLIQASDVHLIDMVTGRRLDTISYGGRLLNAAAYNPVDNFVYAYDLDSDQIVRVGMDGNIDNLGRPNAIPADLHLIVGEIDQNGRYWLAGNPGGAPWYQVNINNQPPTVMEQGTITGGGIGNTVAGADWVRVPGAGNHLYRVRSNDAGTQSLLYRFNMGTGQHEFVASLGDLADNTFGAAYADRDGNMYVSSNGTGRIFRIDVQARTAEVFTNGPASGNNDGARCPNSRILTDFGDAPNRYGTTLGADGPRHGIPDLVGGQAPLMLGATIDHETDGAPSGGANGDGAEDGVTGPIVMAPGEPTAVTVTATNNTGENATLAGWIDLNGNGAFDGGERRTVNVPANSGAADYQLTFPAGTLRSPTYARFRLFPPGSSITPTGPASAGEVEDYRVNIRRLTIDKSSDATAETRVGDTVNYTVTVRNTGQADYTAATPASVKDDLSGVLDDATYNGDESASAGTVSYAEPRLSWSGPLAVGAEVTISYSATLNKNGDQNVDNLAYETVCDALVPSCDPPPPDQCVNGVDPATGLACDPVEHDLPHLVIEKVSPDIEDARPGDTISYEITVTNDGQAPFTAARPATYRDDMTEVLDDANYNDDASASFGDVSFSDPRLTWTGALGVGQSATITYTVEYTGLGDQQVDNVAYVPPPCPEDEPDCDPPPPPPCEVDGTGFDPETGLAVDCVRWPKPNLELDKTSPDITAARIGDTVTYTVTATNTGPGDYTDDHPAYFLDDLSGVLDDATYNDDASAPVGTVTYDEPRIQWTGPLASGESVTVTYTATIEDGGDREVKNVAFAVNCDPAEEDCDPPPTPECPPEGKNAETYLWVDCLEEKLPELEIDKSSPNLSKARPGDTVRYKVELTNVGPGDFTEDRLARHIDDLSGVLDDATYNDDAAVAAGDVAYSEPRISWTGELAAGQSVTLRYSVTLTGEGDKSVDNVAFEPPCDPADEGCDPPTPECSPDSMQQVDFLAVDCVEEKLPELKIDKSSPDLEGAMAGDTVSYEVQLTNVGPGDFTEDRLARAIDDMSGVLDDARYNGDVHASSGDVSYANPRIKWTGEIAANESVTLTYSVTLTGDGDGNMENVAFESPCDPTTAKCNPPIPNCEDGIDPATGLACDELAGEVVEELMSPVAAQPTSMGSDLPDTGAQTSGLMVLGGVMMLLAGVGTTLFAYRRRNIG